MPIRSSYNSSVHSAFYIFWSRRRYNVGFLFASHSIWRELAQGRSARGHSRWHNRSAGAGGAMTPCRWLQLHQCERAERCQGHGLYRQSPWSHWIYIWSCRRHSCEMVGPLQLVAPLVAPTRQHCCCHISRDFAAISLAGRVLPVKAGERAWPRE